MTWAFFIEAVFCMIRTGVTIMYISRNRNGNYYTRVCLPKTLKDAGFPNEVRFSLLTKNREQAIDRHLVVLGRVRAFISVQVKASNREEASLSSLRRSVKSLQNNGFKAPSDSTDSTKTSLPANLPHTKEGKANTDLLKAFLEFKKKSQIRYSSISQLQSRISHFLSWLNKPVTELNSRDAIRYEDLLLEMGNAFKTKKDYLAATKQFCEWLKRHELIKDNFIASIKLPQSGRLNVKQSEQRSRWSEKQLKVLFKHQAFATVPSEHASQKEKEDFWVPLILLYTGARSGEICQLKTCDIYQHDGIWCIDINTKGQDRHLKSAYSSRLIPVHSLLVKLGLIDYVQTRIKQRQSNLFSFKPIGEDKDWAKPFANRFNKVLESCGLVDANRPTLHSFRHTFIDELQQAGIPESITSKLVGHSKQNITYNRYGKRISLQTLSESIEKIRIFAA